MKTRITTLIDFFYPPFRKFMPLQTFRYAACGGGNTVLDIFIYYISYHYIYYNEHDPLALVHTPIGAMTPHVAAFITGFVISFPLGFYLSRTIVFNSSTLRGRIQLFRYFLLVLACIAMNYYFIKLFVEKCHIYPTVSKILTTIIVVSFSFVTQKNFTFKVQGSEVVK